MVLALAMPAGGGAAAGLVVPLGSRASVATGSGNQPAVLVSPPGRCSSSISGIGSTVVTLEFTEVGPQLFDCGAQRDLGGRSSRPCV